MRKTLLLLLICYLGLGEIFSQVTNGVVALELPVRNSLVFNRNILNPTFSFVREQNKFVSAYNKRQWVQFADAPTSYLLSYSGRFAENVGAGVTLFQQNVGVLTTFGGVLNFAYNTRLDRDLNLTFGLNVSAFSSGINEGNIVTNFPDPALNNIESNFLVSANPGINLGTTFFDFGVSLTNLFTYNIQTSEMIKDNPASGIQGHLMYTGYMSSRGFFDDSKFSGLVRSEFRQDETIISANAMLNVPKGFWVQAGYNTKFGASGGLGLNITESIAIEYNFETSIGQFTGFGPSHEITLAYRFKNDRYFDYSSQDEVTSLIKTKKYKRPQFTRVVKRQPTNTESETKTNTKDNSDELAAAKLKEEEEEKKREAEALERERQELEAQKLEQEHQAKLLAQQKIEARKKREAEALKRKQEENLRAQELARQKAKEEAERLEKLRKQQEALALAEEKRKAEELKAQKAAEEQERLRQEAERLAEQKRLEEERKARELAEQKAKEAAEKQARREAFEENQNRLEKAKKALAEAKRLEEERQKEEELKRINNPVNENDKALKALSDANEASRKVQADLLERFNNAVELKNENLKTLKEENDRSEQGLKVERPKTFVSATKQNQELAEIKSELDKSISDRNEKIKELEDLYDDMYEGDTIVNDVVMLYYKKELKRLKSEQIEAQEIRADLDVRLKEIELAIEFEKRRRIKRAEYDNEDERYEQGRARLNNLKQTIQTNSIQVVPSDFDHGSIQENNIQILKDINNINDGIYIVLAVHQSEEKRDDFISKALSAGLRDIDFFFDVNTSKYYIYSQKAGSIQEANTILKNKGTQSYNFKMSIIKIDN